MFEIVVFSTLYDHYFRLLKTDVLCYQNILFLKYYKMFLKKLTDNHKGKQILKLDLKPSELELLPL